MLFPYRIEWISLVILLFTQARAVLSSFILWILLLTMIGFLVSLVAMIVKLVIKRKPNMPACL